LEEEILHHESKLLLAVHISRDLQISDFISRVRRKTITVNTMAVR
jgi:hypothetical protein